MLRAFHLNLTALSYIALLVGLFLVYNTVVDVGDRAARGDRHAARARRDTTRACCALFLAEAAVLGVPGCALGLALGRLLADAAVR